MYCLKGKTQIKLDLQILLWLNLYSISEVVIVAFLSFQKFLEPPLILIFNTYSSIVSKINVYHWILLYIRYKASKMCWMNFIVDSVVYVSVAGRRP